MAKLALCNPHLFNRELMCCRTVAAFSKTVALKFLFLASMPSFLLLRFRPARFMTSRMALHKGRQQSLLTRPMTVLRQP